MTTTGVTGGSWRATVSAAGDVLPWDGAPLAWYVAADDRWHVPAREPTVRQQRVAGTPVTETRVRVPNGDVVQRVYSVADRGGITVVEVENESTMPVAVAFDRRDLLTERPIADVPIEGIDLPAGSFVLPLGHRASLRVGVPHDGRGPAPLPPVPTAQQVANGWLARTEQASRLVLPDGRPGAQTVAELTAMRCELLLGVLPDDPAALLVAIDELVRMGEPAEPWSGALADAVEQAAAATGWEVDAGLAAAGRVLTAAGERRARGDLAGIVGRRAPSPRPAEQPAGVFVAPWLERLVACDGILLPAGLPSAWLGQPVEAHRLPVGDRTAVSFAIRWHGPRPAVLWEQVGDPVELRAPEVAPGWSTGEPTGEALWPAPAPPDPQSFS